MDFLRASGTGVIVAGLVIGIGLTGCSKRDDAGAGASSPSSASSLSEVTTEEASDYGALLIPASDVGPDVTTPGGIQIDPGGNPGAAQVYSSPDGARRIIDTILVFPDVATADSNFLSNSATLDTVVTGTPEPVDIGTDGVMAAGTSPDGTKAVTVILFSQDRALVELTYEGAPGDGVPPDVAIDIAAKQADAIAADLPAE